MTEEKLRTRLSSIEDKVDYNREIIGTALSNLDNKLEKMSAHIEHLYEGRNDNRNALRTIEATLATTRNFYDTMFKQLQQGKMDKIPNGQTSADRQNERAFWWKIILLICFVAGASNIPELL